MPLRLILTVKISLPNPQALLAPFKTATRTPATTAQRATAGSTAALLKR